MGPDLVSRVYAASLGNALPHNFVECFWALGPTAGVEYMLIGRCGFDSRASRFGAALV